MYKEQIWIFSVLLFYYFRDMKVDNWDNIDKNVGNWQTPNLYGHCRSHLCIGCRPNTHAFYNLLELC